MKKCNIIFVLVLIALLLGQCKSSFDVKEANVLIQGIWAQKEDENADFVISGNKVDYFDSGYLYNYEINNKKDFMILDSNQIILRYKIIKLTKDSLIIQSKDEGTENMIYKYYKR